MGLETYYGATPWWKPRTKKMEIQILEYSPTVLKFKVDGETHTLFNTLRMELLNDEDVTFAAYKVEHPLVDRIIFVVRTKEGDPLEAIRRAVERLEKKLLDAKRKFERAFKEGVRYPPFVDKKEWEEFVKKNIG